MANAGTVVVDFAAETAKFTAELKKVQGSLKRLETDFKSVERVAGVALRFFSGAALIGFARQAFNAADALGDAAERAGIAVESFSRLKFAAEQSDVEFEALTTGIRKFQVELSRAAERGNAAAGTFAQIGLSGKQLKDLALEQQLAAVADAFQRIQSPADRVRVATELFGRSGQQLIPLLSQGAAGISKLTAEADRLGITMSGATAEGIDQADKAIKRLTSTLQSYAAKFAAGLSIVILGPPDEQQQLDLRIRQLQERQRQLLGGVGGDLNRLEQENPVRTELKAINEELGKLIAQQRIALGLGPIPLRHSGPLSRKPQVNIRSPLEEIDLDSIRSLKIPEDPFGDRFDPDVFRAQANEEFRNAELTLAEETADRKKEIEARVTSDLQEQFAIRSQAVTAFQNQQMAAENAMLAARANALSAGIQALQAFAGQSKKVAIALVLINKAKAIATAIQNTIVGATLQLTTGDPYTAVARAAAVKAWGAVQVAAIAATGYGEIQAINQSGGAPLGSAVNPINTVDSNASDAGASSQRTVQVVINGNFFGNRETIDMLIEGIKEAVEDRDVVLISGTSRNAKDLLGG